MTKKELIKRRNQLSQAIKKNRQVIKGAKRPHLRDKARMTINILKRNITKINNEIRRIG